MFSSKAILFPNTYSLHNLRFIVVFKFNNLYGKFWWFCRQTDFLDYLLETEIEYKLI